MYQASPPETPRIDRQRINPIRYGAPRVKMYHPILSPSLPSANGNLGREIARYLIVTAFQRLPRKVDQERKSWPNQAARALFPPGNYPSSPFVDKTSPPTTKLGRSFDLRAKRRGIISQEFLKHPTGSLYYSNRRYR